MEKKIKKQKNTKKIEYKENDSEIIRELVEEKTTKTNNKNE